MNWQTPNQWADTHHGMVLKSGTLSLDLASIQKFVDEELEMQKATVYRLSAISTDPLDVLGVRVQMIDAPDGAEIKLAEKRVYNYHGLPLVAHKWVQKI